METKTKRNLVIWGVVILVLLNVTSLATIWYHRYQYKSNWANRSYAEKSRIQRQITRPNQRPPRPNFITRDLDLTEAEQVKFDSIWQYFGIERRIIEDSLEINRLEMAKIMAAQELDTTLFYSISAQQSALMESLNRTMLQMNIALRKNLNEDQMHTFLQKMERIENKRMSARRMSPDSRERVK